MSVHVQAIKVITVIFKNHFAVSEKSAFMLDNEISLVVMGNVHQMMKISASMME